MKQFKHFIYTDNDIINSYLSQINDGLLQTMKHEIQDQTSTSKSKQISEDKVSADANVGIPRMFNLGIKTIIGGEVNTEAISQLESGKELIEKIMHDNAFEHFFQYLKENQLIKSPDDVKSGDFIEVSGNYQSYDIDFLTKLFNDKYLNLLSPKGKGQNSNEDRKNIKNIISMIEMLSILLPSTQLLVYQNYLIILNKKYLRDDLQYIKFKYNGNINIVGKYTNKMSDIFTVGINYSGLTEGLNTLNDALISFLKSMLNLKDDTKILIPIALYFQ